MTFAANLFSLAKKLGLFSPVGSIVYSIIPCFMYLPYFYGLVNSGMKTNIEKIALMFPCVEILYILTQPWCIRHLYHGFVKSIPSNKLTGPDFLWILILTLVLAISKILMLVNYAVGLQIQFTIMFAIGTICWSFTTIFSFLVIRTPCAYLSYLANECSTSGIIEEDVLACIQAYKKFVQLSGKTLFIFYSFVTLELVLVFYWFMIFVSCIHMGFIFMLSVLAMSMSLKFNLIFLGNEYFLNKFLMLFTLKLFTIGITVDDTHTKVQDITNRLRLELRMSKNKEKRQKMKILIQEVQSCPPFSALGFYTVNRSTLTATMGTMLTYCVILYQTVTCDIDKA